jgi:hypothetical protein
VFIGLVMTRLPRTYQNCLDDAMDGETSVERLLKTMGKLAMVASVLYSRKKLRLGNMKIAPWGQNNVSLVLCIIGII